MKRPSATITASALAGLATSVVWELIATFTNIVLSAGLIAASVTLVSSVVGFMKKETVLDVRQRL